MAEGASTPAPRQRRRYLHPPLTCRDCEERVGQWQTAACPRWALLNAHERGWVPPLLLRLPLLVLEAPLQHSHRERCQPPQLQLLQLLQLVLLLLLQVQAPLLQLQLQPQLLLLLLM